MEYNSETIVPAYKWANEVKDLYDRKCISCGRSVKLEAHHVVPKCESKRLSCVLENGVALCHWCHQFVHRNSLRAAPIKTIIDQIKQDELILSVNVPKGKKATIQAHAEQQGESLNAFINRAIDETMTKEATGDNHGN